MTKEIKDAEIPPLPTEGHTEDRAEHKAEDQAAKQAADNANTVKDPTAEGIDEAAAHAVTTEATENKTVSVVDSGAESETKSESGFGAESEPGSELEQAQIHDATQLHTAPLNFATPNADPNAAPSTDPDALSPKVSASEACPPESCTPEGAIPPAPSQEQNVPSQEQAEPIVMGLAGKVFAHMSMLAPLYLLLLFALHMAASIYLPSVYFPAEMAHIHIFEKMQAAGQWLIPPANETLGVTMPGYYWFMALVKLLPLPESIFLPVLAALTALIGLMGAYTLALCTKLGAHKAFASALLLLSCPLFLIFMHMVGPEMLTAGFFALSVGLLFRGWTRDSAPFSFIFGFTFLALATLTGGFLPLWTALIASLFLVLWRCALHRAHQLDAVIGFGFLVLSFALWLVLSILSSENASALDAIMLEGIAPFMPPYGPLPLPWPLVLLAFGLLPWILVPIFASWFSVLSKAWPSLKASRTDNSGPTWLYLLAFTGTGLVLLQKNDSPFNVGIVLPLLPIWGLILAKTVCNLSRVGSNLFFLLLALCLLICGVAITIISVPATAPYWTGYVTEDIAKLLRSIIGLPIISAVFILTALLLVRFTKRAFPQGALLVMALFSLFMAQPIIAFVAPSLAGHAAMPHAQGAGLGTLPANIAPHMPSHPVGHFPVAPIEGEEIPQNPEPTPVIKAPEPEAQETVPAAEEPAAKEPTEEPTTL